MTANRSTAVMQRKRAQAPGELNYFPTPPFATRALCEWLGAQGHNLNMDTAWEPACGELHMVRPLREYLRSVRASDVYLYGEHELIDFTVTGATEPPADWIITNPPFRLAEAFITTAALVARKGFAMLVRIAFLESEGREALFRDHPPSYVLVFTERVVMLEGRLIRRGALDPFSAKENGKASSATSYCWLVWMTADVDRDTRLRWISPCFRELEREGDYPEYAAMPEVPGPLL